MVKHDIFYYDGIHHDCLNGLMRAVVFGDTLTLFMHHDIVIHNQYDDYDSALYALAKMKHFLNEQGYVGEVVVTSCFYEVRW